MKYYPQCNISPNPPSGGSINDKLKPTTGVGRNKLACC